MNKRHFLKTTIGSAIAFATGIPEVKAPYVPICDKLLPWQTFTQKSGVAQVLRYMWEFPTRVITKEESLDRLFNKQTDIPAMTLGMHNMPMELCSIKDPEQFDRKYFSGYSSTKPTGENQVRHQ